MSPSAAAIPPSAAGGDPRRGTARAGSGRRPRPAGRLRPGSHRPTPATTLAHLMAERPAHGQPGRPADIEALPAGHRFPEIRADNGSLSGTLMTGSANGGQEGRGVDGNSERLLTPGEVAALFRVDPKTVTRWAASGRISSIRTPGGHRRFRESEVRALLRGEPQATPDRPSAQ